AALAHRNGYGSAAASASVATPPRARLRRPRDRLAGGVRGSAVGRGRASLRRPDEGRRERDRDSPAGRERAPDRRLPPRDRSAAAAAGRERREGVGAPRSAAPSPRALSFAEGPERRRRGERFGAACPIAPAPGSRSSPSPGRSGAERDR